MTTAELDKRVSQLNVNNESITRSTLKWGENISNGIPQSSVEDF